MTFQFICTQCCRPGSSTYNACYTENSSTAFPKNILRNLKCPHGRNPNWKYIEEGYLDIHVPRNLTKDTVSQKQERKEGGA